VLLVLLDLVFWSELFPTHTLVWKSMVFIYYWFMFTWCIRRTSNL